MAREKKRPERERKAAADYYKLKTGAVDDLINANVTNTPEVSPAEIRKYKRASRFSIPEAVKYIFVKWWFAGVVCYFFWLGLGDLQLTAHVLVTGIILGMAMHALSNGFIRLKAEKPGSNDGWMLFPKPGIGWMLCNVVYGILLSLLSITLYAALELQSAIGPILFGVFTVAWDGLFLLMKKLFTRILEDAKKNAGGGA